MHSFTVDISAVYTVTAETQEEAATKAFEMLVDNFQEAPDEVVNVTYNG